MLIGALVILNIPMFLVVVKLFFDDWDGFRDALKFSFTPDIISMVRGEWAQVYLAEMKLFLCLAFCAAAVIGEYQLISRMFL